MRLRRSSHAALTVAVAAAACGPRQAPADLAPALITRITEIWIEPPIGVCPGESFSVRYTAVLDDGGTHALDAALLERTSAHAEPLADGGWRADADPLVSMRDGFRLRVALLARPELQAEALIQPVYDCLPRAYAFGAGSFKVPRWGPQGANGPDIDIHLGVASSAFYSRLYVAAIMRSTGPLVYVLADADAVPPADWLTVTSRGGRGSPGASGTDGSRGLDGSSGCPGSAGGAGGDGANGEDGGAGGNGGRITVIVPESEPALADLVNARSVGGDGGMGGRGGSGGSGGDGGGGSECSRGATGPSGSDGRSGWNGSTGKPGEARVRIVPADQVFRGLAPLGLADLLHY